VHDLIPILYPPYVTPFYAWQTKVFLPNALKKASIIFSVSHSTKNDIIRKYKIDPEKIWVSPNGVSDHFRPASPTEIQSFCKKQNLNNPFILFVGAIEPKKNIPTIIKAFYIVRRDNPGLELVIAGKKSWKYKGVFELVHSLKLDESVRFLDFVPYQDLPILYSAASVFVFPSNYEGFGLPPLEAMKCGTPVIVSNRSSLPEIVGPLGHMIEPDDYKDLSIKIKKFLDDDCMRSEHISYNLERASEFTWARCAEETKKGYDKALNM
ncbi:MAG TPA: glycosyltransferase family 1 protein, partial [Methanospirillum sp.]|nr:glycosyltransferase family 1 protein [Methanospirillum sp.]